MREWKIAIKLFAWMFIITGLIYPLLITGIVSSVMPDLAAGSLISKNGSFIGSTLIGQKMDKNQYFWPRPSSINYDPLAPSGGSQLGAASKKLKEIVAIRKSILGPQAPADLIYSSGSGLDPHISLDAAYFQISRVASLRSIPEATLKNLVDAQHTKRQFYLLGQEHVNVLTLNQVLDEYSQHAKP